LEPFGRITPWFTDRFFHWKKHLPINNDKQAREMEFFPASLFDKPADRNI